MDNKVVFFLPTRKGSLRVENKNTRQFSSMKGGLLENKLRQLVKSKEIDEILLSTNDPECMRIAEPFVKESEKIRIVPRSDELCLDTTNLQDLIMYVPTITDAEHILWGHVTTPIVDEIEYDKAIRIYKEKQEEGFDSLISVVEFKNFLLNEKAQLINNTTNLQWPRTQDLETLYEINHAIFITNRNVYKKEKNRIGKSPYLYVMDKIKSIDVDWEDDFKIAEMIYEKHYRL
jgi:CMP-N-acetylneuraminic acid synthetase